MFSNIEFEGYTKATYLHRAHRPHAPLRKRGWFWNLQLFIGRFEYRYGKGAPLFIFIVLMGIMFLWSRLL